jgi:hypothetical protein
VVEVVALVALASALVMVILPDRRTGERFLIRWGIERPTPEQAKAGARYLRQRRVLYPLCWLVGPSLAYAVASLLRRGADMDERGWWGLLASILAALLLAELIAALRPARGSIRSAVLSRRRWPDLVPHWAVAFHLLLVALAIVQSVAALAMRDRVGTAFAPGASTAGQPDPAIALRLLDTTGSWLVLVEAALGLVGVYGVVLLAVRRRAEADLAVDRVLRTRSARVAVGVGIGLALGLLSQTSSRAVELRNATGGVPHLPGWLDLPTRLGGTGTLVVLVVGLAAWRIVAAPLKLSDTVPA